jgi:micrococcal nuclease
LLCGRAVTLSKTILTAVLAWVFFLIPSEAGQVVFAGSADKPAQVRAEERQARTVIRVIDGDTLVLSPNEKVRLIGVDTPETKHPKKAVECFGREATKFTKNMVAGKRVRLKFDDVNATRGHRDRYGRTLAYVYLEDGTLLNAEIIRKGYGHAFTQFPFRYLLRFRNLERQARERGMGLWSDCHAG